MLQVQVSITHVIYWYFSIPICVLVCILYTSTSRVCRYTPHIFILISYPLLLLLRETCELIANKFYDVDTFTKGIKYVYWDDDFVTGVLVE